MNQRQKNVLKIIFGIATFAITGALTEFEWASSLRHRSDSRPPKMTKTSEIPPAKTHLPRHRTNNKKRKVMLKARPEIALRIFGANEFREANKGPNHVALVDCILNKHIQPHYHVCTFKAKKDMHVSGSIRSGRGWEGHISLLLIRMLKNYGQGAILLDIGTNIGSHALYGAINNFLVFGVEPQTVNLVKVYQGALLNNNTQNIKLFQHTIDSERRNVTLKQTYGNIGGSFVTGAELGSGPSYLNSTSVLLSDILEQVVLDKYDGIKPLDIVMKIDIEHYECHGFLGSPSVLNNDRFVIRHVIMEWTYGDLNGRGSVSKTGSPCSRERVREMATMFVKNGYEPFGVSGSPRDVKYAAHWNEDILWTHNSAKDPFDREPLLAEREDNHTYHRTRRFDSQFMIDLAL